MVLWIFVALRARASTWPRSAAASCKQDMRAGEIRLETADLSTIEALVEELAHPEPKRVAYAIDLLESLDKRHLVTPLLLHHEIAAVRVRALQWRRPPGRPAPTLAARHRAQADRHRRRRAQRGGARAGGGRARSGGADAAVPARQSRAVGHGGLGAVEQRRPGRRRRGGRRVPRAHRRHARAAGPPRAEVARALGRVATRVPAAARAADLRCRHRRGARGHPAARRGWAAATTCTWPRSCRCCATGC